jgi:hypothetical protein
VWNRRSRVDSHDDGFVAVRVAIIALQILQKLQLTWGLREYILFGQF